MWVDLEHKIAVCTYVLFMQYSFFKSTRLDLFNICLVYLCVYMYNVYKPPNYMMIAKHKLY